MAGNGKAGGAVPQPTDRKAPGAGTLPVLSDGPQPQKLSPEDARAILRGRASGSTGTGRRTPGCWPGRSGRMCGTGKAKSHGRSSVGFVGLLLIASHGFAQEPVIEDAPARYQGTEHFYNAVGRGVTAEWSADRTEVPAGGDIVATLTVRGATNPHRVRRPNLRDLPAFADRFQVIDGDDPPAAAGAKEVGSRTSCGRGRRRWTRSRARIQVPPPRGGQLADHLREEAADPGAAGPAAAGRAAGCAGAVLPLADDYREPSGPGWFGGLGCVLAVPAAVAVWVVLWRLRNPDGVRLAKLRRNRAVAKALDGLKRAGKSSDPAANAAAAVRVYLIERWGMPPAAAVPGEVAARWRRRSCRRSGSGGGRVLPAVRRGEVRPGG